MNPYAKLNADQDRDAGAKYHQGQADPARDMSDFMAKKADNDAATCSDDICWLILRTERWRQTTLLIEDVELQPK